MPAAAAAPPIAVTGGAAIARVVAGAGGSIKAAIALANEARLSQSQAIDAIVRVTLATGRMVGSVVNVADGAKVITSIVVGAGQPVVYVSASGVARFGTARLDFAVDKAGNLITTITQMILK